MTMGERLRQAREEAGLSQRQVCGDQITRNQLSQLEHDRVGPSVETLRYLARQLGKPVSYFLGEISPNLQVLQEVRTTQDPVQALRRLAGYRPDGSVADDLAVLLEALLCLAASDQAAAEGSVPYARRLVAQGHEALKRCVFPSEDLEQGLRLREAELAEEPDFLPAAQVWARSRELVLLARLSLAQDCPARALALLEDLPDRLLLRGLALYRLGRYQEALALLRREEAQVTPEQAPQLWRLLEACCRESGDYRGAYEYAAKLRPPAEP